MNGLMMRDGLLASSLIEHAAANHGQAQIVSALGADARHRYTYTQCELRAKRAAQALRGLGLRKDDRIATLAWNGYRHVELFYGICGMGGICHTLNPRLAQDQLLYIMRHAQDRALIFDLSLLPLVAALAPHLDPGMLYIALTEPGPLPQAAPQGTLCYEALLAAQDDRWDWPALDEYQASTLCYTSGTTGRPKGVLHTHRSLVLSAFVNCMTDVFGYSMHDAICPVTPMFHGNAWGSPFGAAMAGAKLVLPGQDVSGPTLYELIESEGVTLVLGVPTVWLGLLEHVARHGLAFTTLRRVLTGGTAPHRGMLRQFEHLGVELIHAWGMTEISPTGTVSRPTPLVSSLDAQQQEDYRLKQGHGIYGVRRRIVGPDGGERAHDGVCAGEFRVRGPLVAGSYYGTDGQDDTHDEQGWLRTGDMATLDRHGYLTIVDRSKDMIKSGGEWISSIDVENIAMNHPDIKEAAMIGVPHPRWGERPLLIVTPAAGRHIDKAQILGHLGLHLARWQLPDDIVVAQLPHAATGKVNKLALRQAYRDYALPAPDASRTS